MSGRPLVAAMIALGLAGCGKRLNPEYCANHPNDPDCRGADLVVIDAPQGCMSNATCTEMGKTVCELQTGNCVQCVPGVDTSACTGNTTVCGEDRLCHGCVVDMTCPSAVCLPSGDCANETDVLYASPMGTGNCTKATPCTFTQAVSMLSTTKKIIKLTSIPAYQYTDPPVVIAKSATILGTSATFTPTGSGPAITITAGDVEIMGITVSGATTAGISCTGGTLTLRRAFITANTGFGIDTLGCDATIERTRVRLNKGGGLSLDTGTFEVRNDVVDANGTTNTVDGNVFLNKAKGRLVFNTIANNLSANGGGAKTGGIKCAGSGMFLVGHNIVVANGGASAQYTGDCPWGTNYFSGSVDAVKFAGTTDYHLTVNSPTSNPIIRDDPDADADCKINGAYIDDYDGLARPYQLCDRGAFEYRP